MKKILLTLIFVLMAAPVYAFTSAIQSVVAGIGSAVVYAKLLGTSDGKWLITSDGKILKTAGTDTTNKILINADDEMLVTTTSEKILTTP